MRLRWDNTRHFPNTTTKLSTPPAPVPLSWVLEYNYHWDQGVTTLVTTPTLLRSCLYLALPFHMETTRVWWFGTGMSTLWDVWDVWKRTTDFQGPYHHGGRRVVLTEGLSYLDRSTGLFLSRDRTCCPSLSTKSPLSTQFLRHVLFRFFLYSGNNHPDGGGPVKWLKSLTPKTPPQVVCVLS